MKVRFPSFCGSDGSACFGLPPFGTGELPQRGCIRCHGLGQRFRLLLHPIQFAEGFIFRALGGFLDHVTEFRKLATNALQTRIFPGIVPGWRLRTAAFLLIAGIWAAIGIVSRVFRLGGYRGLCRRDGFP